MSTGTINVTAGDIFPIIKNFLYSSNEIFLRELISNASDATLKLKALSKLGEIKEDIGDTKIEIIIDKEKSTINIVDRGIGMSAKEIDNFINNIAFSGAKAFIEKYKNTTQGIIGHFGLGFYSSFMVADQVEIYSKSYKKEIPAVHWTCDVTPNFKLELADKKERGTEIILHFNTSSKEFLTQQKITELLGKYCKFMPIPIKFGEKEEIDKFQKKIKVDNIINDTSPCWVRQPSELNNDDYKNFYNKLYPNQVDEPIFWIHLNINHPFNLTGILFFPKFNNKVEIQKDKIKLYQNQVFITDNLEGIVPEFLQLLRGVIDSPDIPLNVSRSSLQSDSAVSKISNYITRKVADKLYSLFKNERNEFEKKWEYIKIIIEYGILSEPKFFEKTTKFALYPNTEGKYFTFDEFTTKISKSQKDKYGKLIYLYADNKEKQYSYISTAKDKGYDVLLLYSIFTQNLIQKLEMHYNNISFTRVDADTIDNIIKKYENLPSKLSSIEKNNLKKLLEKNIDQQKFHVVLENLYSSSLPFVITIPEYPRRIKEMNNISSLGINKFAEQYNLVINTNHKLLRKILDEQDANIKKNLILHALDLAMLSKNILQGESLSRFISKTFESL